MTVSPVSAVNASRRAAESRALENRVQQEQRTAERDAAERAREAQRNQDFARTVVDQTT